jgi:hypothetical protein
MYGRESVPVMPNPIALVISDFPIVAATAKSVLQDRYDVVTRSWTAYAWEPVREAELVIVDVTTMSPDAALALIGSQLPEARLVAFSLHSNEVQVYRVRTGGLAKEGRFPSLFALVA